MGGVFPKRMWQELRRQPRWSGVVRRRAVWVRCDARVVGGSDAVAGAGPAAVTVGAPSQPCSQPWSAPRVDGHRVALTETGQITARYQIRNDTIAYYDAAPNGTKVWSIDVSARGSGSRQSSVSLSSDRYHCAGDTRAAVRQIA
ncbi:hypothetical protein ACLQ25_12085 [Micromonospora sp. DT44]|uniref:hypothetical protein n=1 Tax=Micromonospora sp. DT44 TaxID=3393439 RepID=UPI003CF7330B